jgi:lipopolysaccharide biosynthesis glycosyltransferase
MAVRVPIVFACDEAYALPLAVALESLLRHRAEETFYEIYCLVPEPLTEATLARLDTVRQRHIGFNLTFVPMDGAFATVKMRIKHISFVTYYRLKIAGLLPKHARCVYLDVDLVVQADLAGLMELDMRLADGREALLAGVPHAAYRKVDSVGGFAIEPGHYVNAGVLVMNLGALRKEKLEAEMLALMPLDFETQDQDILNVVGRGRIKALDVSYNFIPKLAGWGQRGAARRFYKGWGMDFEAARRVPKIIHYADRFKPWRFVGQPYGKAWDNAFAESGFAGQRLSRSCYQAAVAKDFAARAMRKARRVMRLA